ncbi:MAG: hypothetical protein ACRDRX_07195 [Pseudonocardiaceae bacterium]
MPNYHVTVHGPDRTALVGLGRAHHAYVYLQTLAADDSGYRVSALADGQTVARLRGAGYRVEQHEDVHQAAQDIPRHAC